MRAVSDNVGSKAIDLWSVAALCLLLLITLVGQPAHAQNRAEAMAVAHHIRANDPGRGQGGRESTARNREPNVAPGEAARRARHKYGGRVLNVILEQGASGPYYRVKLLDGGRVRVVRINARD